MANHLAGSSSPYLLQHAGNPVDWYPWGPEALARARDEDRPIFLSIGYSACHWCHVMAHESFEDPAIAARLNAGFIPIKVDREERPDLDDVYLGAVQAMTGSGGWPLSVFLTPDLEPFYGGTYFPPEDRHGLPAFGRVLDALAESWASQRGEITRSAAEIAGHLRHQVEVEPGSGGFDQLPLEAATRRLLGLFDPRNGGFGGAPKFPAPMVLEFLLRRWARDRDPGLLRPVTVTLDRMADGGIHDLLAGGFARYSTDEHWLVPHFEKMLYDNALLAHVYLEGHRATGDPRYASVARSTFGFLLSEMQTDGGGFAAALDADSEGEEGRFYTWPAEEVTAVLRAAGLSEGEIATVAGAWDVQPGGNWEGRTILHRLPGHEVPDPLEERARTALLGARDQRIRPGRDGKQLAAWNGMALRALAHGALVLGDPELATATARLVAFIRTELIHDGDRLWRLPVSEDGQSTAGFAEDYALIADGLLDAYAALGDPTCFDLAAALTARLLAGFWDEEAGLLRDTGAEHEALITQPRSVIDSATPSANAVAADVLLRLAVVTSDETLDRRARQILSATAGAWAGQPTMFGRTLAAADRALAEAIDVVVVADPEDPAGRALRRAAAAAYAPNLVIAAMTPTDERIEPLFAAKTARGHVATAYVCRGSLCLAPTADPDTVAEQVRSLGAPGAEPLA